MLTKPDWNGLKIVRGARTLRFAAVLALGAGVLGAAAGTASARSLDFESVPVTDAVAQIDRTFDSHITLKPGVNADAHVTFSVDDLADPGARLEAINNLANALNADFAKVFVIGKSAGDAAVSDPAIDAADAPVVFENAVPAEDAIRTIAGVDDATVRFYAPVHGDVTFPTAEMTAEAAAREVARQTHTTWTAYYTITPRHGSRARAAVDGKIIGYTSGGQPITELPITTFRETPAPAADVPPKAAAPTAKDAADAGKPAADAAPAAPQAPQTPAAAYPYPYYGNGYYGYGASPYGGYRGYYPGYGNGYNGGSTVIGPGSAVSGFNPAGGAGYSPLGYGYSPYGGGGGYGYGDGYSPYGGAGYGSGYGGGYAPYSGAPMTFGPSPIGTLSL